MTGDPDRPPARCALPTTDYLTAVYAAFGTMMALYERTGIVPMRQGPRLMNTAPNSLYPTNDGHWVLIAANNDAIFRRLAAVMRHAEWTTDPRYATQRARGERVEEVDGLVTAWARERSANEVRRLLDEAEVPVAPVYTIADIFEDQHYRAREMLMRIPHPKLGEVTMAGVVPKLSRTPGRVVKAGSGIGEDTRDVLTQDLGMSEADVARLERTGAVWCGMGEHAMPASSQAAAG
jgi:crotonobetainyl-CoA:carnitine CoA-transferase CaiB-like acyl-CoA transferase